MFNKSIFYNNINKHHYKSILNLKTIKKIKNILYFIIQTIQNFLYFIYINLFYLSNNAAIVLFLIINYLYLRKYGNLSKKNIEYLCYFCNLSLYHYCKNLISVLFDQLNLYKPLITNHNQ